MYRITNLLLVLIVTLLFVLPTSAIMYASGSPQDGDDGGSMDNNDDESDTWSMDKSNNALDSKSPLQI